MGLTKLQNEIIQIIKERRERNKLSYRVKNTIRRLKNKMTNARYLPQIDSLYVYNLKRPVPFTHREQPEAGYRYKNRHVLLQSKEGEINIYHQSFKIGGVIKGVTIVTLDSDKNRVKKFFKDAIKEVKEDGAKLAVFNVATKPVQLDIFHVY